MTKGTVDKKINIEDNFFVNDIPVKRYFQSETLLKIIERLDALPYGKMYNYKNIYNKVGSSERNFNRFIDSLQEYTCKVGSKRFWGNKKTIADYLKFQSQNEGE